MYYELTDEQVNKIISAIFDFYNNVKLKDNQYAQKY